MPVPFTISWKKCPPLSVEHLINACVHNINWRNLMCSLHATFTFRVPHCLAAVLNRMHTACLAITQHWYGYLYNETILKVCYSDIMLSTLSTDCHVTKRPGINDQLLSPPRFKRLPSGYLYNINSCVHPRRIIESLIFQDTTNR